jgi:hypothetical protein
MFRFLECDSEFKEQSTWNKTISASKERPAFYIASAIHLLSTIFGKMGISIPIWPKPIWLLGSGETS